MGIDFGTQRLLQCLKVKSTSHFQGEETCIYFVKNAVNASSFVERQIFGSIGISRYPFYG